MNTQNYILSVSTTPVLYPCPHDIMPNKPGQTKDLTICMCICCSPTIKQHLGFMSKELLYQNNVYGWGNIFFQILCVFDR